MRIYKSVQEAYYEIERDLVEMGIRVHPKTMQNKNVERLADYDTFEIQNYQYTLVEWRDLYESFRIFGWNWSYVEAELADRLSRTPLNPGNSYRQRYDVWKEFLNEAGMFDYTYSERICNQLNQTIRVLRNDPDSRQGILQIYDQHLDSHHRGGIKRIPCSMHYQALIRGDRLDLTYVMRSCDFYTHFPYDMALATLMLEHLAIAVEVQPGHLIHNICSLHMFRKDARPGVF